MSGYQLVVVTGNLFHDAAVSAVDGGGFVAELTVAVTETYSSAAGAKEEHTEYVDVRIYGPAAALAEKLGKKGRLVTVQGRLHTDRWTEKDGTKQQHTCVIANQGMTFHSHDEHTQISPHRQRPMNFDGAMSQLQEMQGHG